MIRTLLLALGLVAVAAPAHAAISLCNQTTYILYAAIGYR